MKSQHSFWVGVIAGFGLLLPPTRSVALDPSRTVYQYNCRTWMRETGLPVNAIRAIVQTKDGYLWLGTQKGLVRFDGVSFETISLPADLQFRPGIVGTLASSVNGGLWFGVENGSMGFFDETKFHSMENLPWVNPQMRIGAMREDKRGLLWVGAAGGLGLYRRNNTNDAAFLGQVTGITAMCEDAQHRVWLGTADDGLYSSEQGNIKPFPDATLKKEAIFALASDSHGTLWVGTQAGLRCYDANFIRTDPFPSLIDVKTLLTDRHGAVWIGSAGDGLIRSFNGKAGYLGRENGLANDFITALCEDSEGSLWVGTREGLSQLSDVKFPIFSRADGLVRGSCHGVCASTNGGIWSANTEGLSRFDGSRFVNYSRQVGLRNAYVKRVFEAKDGDIYFINAERTGGREVDVLSHGEIVARHPAKNWPIAFAEDAHGVVVGVAGDLFRVSKTEFTPFVYQDGISPEFRWVRNLYGCPDGSILVASVNGLFLIKDRILEHWAVDDGLSDYDVQCVCMDRDGAIWAGLQTGVARIKGRQIRNIDRSHGLADNNILAIVPDNHGDLWMHSSRGFLRLNGRSANDFADGRTNKVECPVYDGMESVKSIDTSDVEFSGCRSTDGRIWFPTPPGPVIIDPDHIPVDTVP
ncbi:MAG: two-component regulator propeller domain-containing protein, partial [Limisphaerales bacterium]